MESDDETVRIEEQLAAEEAGRIGGDGGRPAGESEADHAVREAGGGEAEGFEESEQALIDAAQHTDLGHSPRNDAWAPEAESDRTTAEYGEADEEESPDR
jgi:hypothetical protein